MRMFIAKKTTVVSFLAVATLAAGSLAAPSRVQAAESETGFAELVLGQATPLGEEQWDDAYDSVVKFGLRGGVWASRGMGFELALDYTPLDDYDTSGPGYSFHSDMSRLRLLIGGRGGAKVAKNIRVFGRVLVGADYMRGSADGMVLGVSFSGDESDVGLGAEIGGGVLISLGSAFSVGAQIAIPLAFHFTEQDIQDERYIDFDYNAYDLDLMLTLGTSF